MPAEPLPMTATFFLAKRSTELGMEATAYVKVYGRAVALASEPWVVRDCNSDVDGGGELVACTCQSGQARHPNLIDEDGGCGRGSQPRTPPERFGNLEADSTE